MTLVLIAGEIHHYPGPVKFPYSAYNKSVTSRQKAVECDVCYHSVCVRISLVEYKNLMNYQTLSGAVLHASTLNIHK